MERLKFHIVVDRNTNRVLFAEAGKDFVDFIFHILYLPLGAVSTILSETSDLGSVGTLLEGLKNLDPRHVKDSNWKQNLLDFVKTPYRGSYISQLLPGASFSQPHTYYRCRKHGLVLLKPCSDDSSLCCCSELSNTTLTPSIDVWEMLFGAFVLYFGWNFSPNSIMGSDSGYVGDSMFMVRDDLTVCASVATAAFSLLDEFSNKYVGAIEKREVSFGTDEAIKLIKASLSSETVLTDVFLAGGGSC